jgi:site-specific DNA recombinase
MAVAISCRVSTEEQRERQSILTQREFGDRYTALHSLPVFKSYSDDGISGTVPLENRPEGVQILRDARAGRFDQLLVYRLDRLGRDTRLILNAVAELEKLGVRVRSMTEEFDTASATGRLMLTMLSGFATHEREVIRERSVAGTRRVAETGSWLGGIIPYGYRKAGEHRDARIVVSDELIPDLGMSEADVVRMIYHMAAAEKKSCRKIAEHLNALHVPCAYARDGRLVLRNKRKERTRGIWMAPRVNRILASTTYYGVHAWGKRTASKRQPVTRAVPAIVTEDIWKKAQATIKSHLLFSVRGARHKFLLRGLIKCKLCGLTYIGMKADRTGRNGEFYYRCNGAHTPRLLAAKCTAKNVRGDDLERQVWADIQSFLRDPGPVLAQIQARMEAEVQDTGKVRERLKRLETAVEEKAAERNRVVALYRRGRLTDAGLDAQMDEIAKEEAALHDQIAGLQSQLRSVDTVANAVDSAEALLTRLRTRLDQPVSWELKRQLVETLVAGIQVETFETCGVKQARTTVTYRFGLASLPTLYVGGRVIRIPAEAKTIGDHIRRKRLSMGLRQKDAAKHLGVTAASVYNWEANKGVPEFRSMPAVIHFLGYNPLPAATTTAQQLVRRRTELGMSQKEAAQQMGVDPSTLARWERGEREPDGPCAKRIARFLAQPTRLCRAS